MPSMKMTNDTILALGVLSSRQTGMAGHPIILVLILSSFIAEKHSMLKLKHKYKNHNDY